MDADTLSRLASSPAAFRGAFVIDDNGELRPLPDAMSDWQRERAKATDAAWQRCVGIETTEPGLQRAFALTPRGEGKTSYAAVEALWPLFASRRRVLGVACAADQDQAALLADAARRHCDANQWLGHCLTFNKACIVNKFTGS